MSNFFINYQPSDGDANFISAHINACVEKAFKDEDNGVWYPKEIASYLEKNDLNFVECVDTDFDEIFESERDAFVHDNKMLHPTKPNGWKSSIGKDSMTLGEWLDKIAGRVITAIRDDNCSDWLYDLAENDPASLRGLLIKINARIIGRMSGDAFDTIRGEVLMRVYDFLHNIAFKQ